MTKIKGESGSPCLNPDAGVTDTSFTTPLPTTNTNGALKVNIINAFDGRGQMQEECGHVVVMYQSYAFARTSPWCIASHAPLTFHAGRDHTIETTWIDIYFPPPLPPTSDSQEEVCAPEMHHCSVYVIKRGRHCCPFHSTKSFPGTTSHQTHKKYNTCNTQQVAR